MKPKITLCDWAAANFAPPPSIRTLRTWARSGRINPRPIKVGRVFMVDQNAQYIEVVNTNSLDSRHTLGLSSRVMEIFNAS